MTAVQGFVLAAVQGITEFVPLSSSAHFILIPWMLGWHIQPGSSAALSVFDELGALLAVVGFFWLDLRGLVRAAVLSLTDRSLRDPQARQAWQLVLATIPAALAGLLLGTALDGVLSRPGTLGAFLVGTGAFLFVADHGGNDPRGLSQTGWWEALLIGIAQAVGLLPGISRCGATVGAGRLCGLDRAASMRFSLWMTAPILLERGIVGIVHLSFLPNLRSDLLMGVGGLLIAATLGYLAIGWLLRYLTTHSFRVFAFYCLALGSVAILLSFVR